MELIARLIRWLTRRILVPKELRIAEAKRAMEKRLIRGGMTRRDARVALQAYFSQREN